MNRRRFIYTTALASAAVALTPLDALVPARDLTAATAALEGRFLQTTILGEVVTFRFKPSNDMLATLGWKTMINHPRVAGGPVASCSQYGDYINLEDGAVNPKAIDECLRLLCEQADMTLREIKGVPSVAERISEMSRQEWPSDEAMRVAMRQMIADAPPETNFNDYQFTVLP